MFVLVDEENDGFGFGPYETEEAARNAALTGHISDGFGPGEPWGEEFSYRGVPSSYQSWRVVTLETWNELCKVEPHRDFYDIRTDTWS